MSSDRAASAPADDLLGPLVKRAHLRLLALTDAALEPTGLDRREFGVLRALAASEPRSQQDLAAELGIDATTMVALIDALESKGALTRRPDPADRRRNAVELTPAGRTIRRRAEAACTVAEQEFLAPLARADAERLRGSLRALLDG